MYRLFPVSLLFLALILLRLGYIHGLFSPTSTAATPPLAPARSATAAASDATARTVAATQPSAQPSGSQARSDAGLVTEP